MPDREHITTTPEPFVSAEAAATFLSVNRRLLLSLARKGMVGAYPLGTGHARKTWVFRLSELAAAIHPKRYDPPRQSPLK